MRTTRLGPLVAAAVIAASGCSTTLNPGAPGTDAPNEVPTSISVPPPPPSQPPTQTLPLVTLPPRAAVCDAFSTVTRAGELRDDVLRELSGIAASRTYPQVLWAHNDSRGGASVYSVNVEGLLLAEWTLENVIALDWEDISAGPGPEEGVNYLYVGDIGDNFALRSEIVVYRFPEPDIINGGLITEFEFFRLSYPEPGPNAEAMAVDPVTGDLILVTKDRDGPEEVWRAPGAELRNGLATRLEPVATLDLGDGVEVTAADITTNGDRIAMRGYDEVWIWPRTSESLAETLSAEPCRAASPDEVQGEALAFDAAGVNLYTVSEGTGAPIFRIDVER